MVYALIGVIVFCILLIVLDAVKMINITALAPSVIVAAVIPHSVMIVAALIKYLSSLGAGAILNGCVNAAVIALITYTLFKFHIRPIRVYRTTRKSLRIMLCGRRLVLLGIYGVFVQIPLCIILYKYTSVNNLPIAVWIADLVVTIITVFLFILNGIIRIFATSKRYGAVKKLIIFLLLLIPVVNIFVLLRYCHIVKLEYDHEAYMVSALDQTVDSEICKTKYPIILVHGVGFRDYKYLNYWGRIPRELTRQGATVYYGHQQAWTTIADSAEFIKNTIFEVMDETKTSKVNIIAHSKGGLDARYLASKLNMGQHIASITTISTPHHGTKLVDSLIGIVPDKLRRFIGKIIDANYRRLGDTTPDFYTASGEFLTSYAEKFNEEVEDNPLVYYQSYMSIMKNPASDWLLTLPYLILYFREGKNDGLVSVNSAKWGNFREVITNKHRRGISHGDIIDLERENIYGFNVLKKYVDIVADLKKMGY